MAKRLGSRKEQPLSMRMPKDDIAIIDRAANIRGRSRTDFVREAAVRAAEDVVMENAMIRLSPAAFKEFVDAISGPGEVVPDMVTTFKRKAPWEN